MMVRAAGVLVTAAIAGLPGCSRPADEARAPTAPVTPAGIALPRTNVSLADRAAWRQHLHWADGCEEAFQASGAGTDGGLTFTSLGDGASLVEVVCAAGSYQPSMVRVRLVESPAGLEVVPLVFPVYTSEDGRQLTLSRETELWGTSLVDAPARTLAVLALARQTGDCGVWTRYSLADAEPRIVSAAAQLVCPMPASEPVNLSPTEPPPGWEPVSRKD